VSVVVEQEIIRIGGRDVTITRPEKVLFPEDEITKRELIDYYRRIAPRILRTSGAGHWPWNGIRTELASRGFSRRMQRAIIPDG
jgi:DNA primase